MRLIVVLRTNQFKKGSLKYTTIPVEYSSKEDFLKDFKTQVSNNTDYLSLINERGSPTNFRICEFFSDDGERYIEPVIYTVEEFFEGRDTSECNKYTSVVSSSVEDINQMITKYG